MHALRRQNTFLFAAVVTMACLLKAAVGFETPPVRVILDGRLIVRGAASDGLLPIAVSQDWSLPQPNVTRAVIVVHGAHRAAEPLFRGVSQMAPDAATLVIAPQFLLDKDIAAHALPADILRWGHGGWVSGADSTGPVVVSSYDAMDALLLTLADRSRFPGLRTVVVSGFSGGGQLAQRYAALGRGPDMLVRSGIALRFVVGSPGSYLYLNGERPNGVPAQCPDYNDWPHGVGGDLPRYVQAGGRTDAAALERRYAALDLVYLVGTADNDPQHWELDKSCGGEAEGADRYSRALNYYRLMQARDAAILKQRFLTAPGAEHNALAVLGSPCGRAALFDAPGCTER